MSDTEYKTEAPDEEQLATPDRIIAAGQALAELLEAHPELPPILSVATNGHRVEVHPWLACAPLSALLAWEAVLAGAVDLRATRLLADPDLTVSTVTATGRVGAVAITVSVSTYRPLELEDPLGRVSRATLVEAAAAEQAIAEAEMAELLDTWQAEHPGN